MLQNFEAEFAKKKKTEVECVNLPVTLRTNQL